MTKVISLSDEAYSTLKSLKKDKESFSEIVIRIAVNEKKRPISDFAGKWEGKKDWKTLHNEIMKFRNGSKFREVNF